MLGAIPFEPAACVARLRQGAGEDLKVLKDHPDWQVHEIACGHNISRQLGTLPISYPVHQESLVVFAGQRWIIESVDDVTKTLQVKPHAGGVVPRFDRASIEPVHDKLAAEMQTVYLSEETPPWVDNPVADFLREGRETFRSSKLDKSFFVSEERDLHVFLWQGSQTNAVFGAAFGMAGIPAEVHDFGITLPKTTKQQAMAAIRKLSAQGSVSAGEVAAFVENIRVGKFAYLVPEELLRAQWARDNSTIVERVPNLAAGLLGAK